MYVYTYISNWIVEYIHIQLYSCTVNVNLMLNFIELSEWINYCYLKVLIYLSVLYFSASLFFLNIYKRHTRDPPSLKILGSAINL